MPRPSSPLKAVKSRHPVRAWRRDAWRRRSPPSVPLTVTVPAGRLSAGPRRAGPAGDPGAGLYRTGLLGRHRDLVAPDPGADVEEAT